jgi:hypothetical protein
MTKLRGAALPVGRFLGVCGAIASIAGLLGAAASCSSEPDPAADGGAVDNTPDTDPIAWVSPTADSVIEVDQVVELTVKVNDPAVKVVRFTLDNKPLDACDVTSGPDECMKDGFFRVTTSFPAAGLHSLSATAPSSSGDHVASLQITVHAAGTGGDAGAPADAGHADAGHVDGGPLLLRGFLDPDRPLHNVFGGIKWSVTGQKVIVASPPTGDTAAVAACMKTYGASIIKHADAYGVSRASVVATALTESSCTNPAGSSDGLSSGPMQVTGSTCAAVAGGGISSAACKAKMHTSPDFSFQIGAKYMGSSYQVSQHGHDPPKIGAAYNAGSVRSSTANRWHMLVTGNHIERWVGAYNAYRAWEKLNGVALKAMDDAVAVRPASRFEGEHAASMSALPSQAPEGQVYFVGDFARRDGIFVRREGGAWHTD